MSAQKDLKANVMMIVFIKRMALANIMNTGVNIMRELPKGLYKVKESRYELGQRLGESKTELYIEGLGWCEYSWTTGAILINGEWLSNWEDLSPGK